MDAPRQSCAPLLALAAISVVACATQPVPPPLATCAAPCATVEEVLYPDYVRLHLHVPPATSLHNAWAGSAQKPGCGSGVPVAEVIVNGQHHAEGPVILATNNIIALRFPFTADREHAALAVAPHAVDLELRGPSGPSCRRISLPAPKAGWLAFVRTLSFRPEPPR